MNRFLLSIALLVPGFSVQAQEIRINELSASVTNSQVDNYGEFADWIELFNSTSRDVDLAGWYISDNPAKPLKWRIPAANPDRTTILAGSYLLLWADKDTLQGPDHLGFALSKKGELLFLYRPAPNGPVLEDSLSYGAMRADYSYGRCPGETRRWSDFRLPTPGKPNVCVPVKKRSPGKIPLPVPPESSLHQPSILHYEGHESIILAINEISNNNKYALTDGLNENDDWIELYNPGTTAINIAGWYISDTLDAALFHRIPSYDNTKTEIPAGGYLILWADAQAAQGVTHLPFKLDKDGEELYLARLTGGQYAIVDEVVFPKAKNDVTYGRIPDGTGQWKRLSDPTPLASNLPPRILGGFVINELMALPGPRMADEFGEEEDWIEFYNPTSDPVNLGGLYLTDSLADPIRSHITVFSPDSTTIPPGGYLLFYADNQTWQGARHLSFKLSSRGDDIVLFQPDGSVKISEIHYPFMTSDASFGRYPDGRESWVFTAPTPGLPNEYGFTPVSGLFINEFMAENDGTLPDDPGRGEDWIEVFNYNDVPVNTGGLYLTDSLTHPLKFRIPDTFPDSTTIPARGYMVFLADDHPELGVRHLNFKLDAQGESIGIAQFSNGQSEFIDSLTYPAQTPDVSYGRLGDASPWWAWFRVPSPAATNSPVKVEGIPLEPAALEIYPNPCFNQLNIKIFLNGSKDVRVDFFSAGGAKLYGLDFFDCCNGWNTLQFDNLDNWLPGGCFNLRIVAGQQVSSGNFIHVK